MEIDIELLISLVEARPVLWDKTCIEYKDKNETKKAWREVCVLLRNDFEEIDDNEKNAFGKQVIKRWANVRDSFKKSCKKEKDSTKSGAGASNIKKYVFNKQLQFLNKVFEQRTTFDSLTQDIESSESTEDKSANEKEKEDFETFKKPCKQLGSRKRKNVDEIELKMLKALEEPADRHLSFFKGIIPTLNNFSDDEVVQFQLEVMQLITKIKKQRSVYHHQRMYQLQPVYQTLRPESQPIYQTLPPQSQPIYQKLHPQSHQAYQNLTCKDNASQQIFTAQLSSIASSSIQSPPPSTATSASQFYRVYGEELSTASSPLSTNSSMDDSIDFADTNLV